VPRITIRAIPRRDLASKRQEVNNAITRAKLRGQITNEIQSKVVDAAVNDIGAKPETDLLLKLEGNIHGEEQWSSWKDSKRSRKFRRKKMWESR
jgi:hypothetical protein